LAHHVTGGAIRLWELPNHPGTYEARFDDTSKEGSYGFSFSASGSMIDGGHFSRSRSMSKYLTPTISPGLTGLSWIPGAIRDNVQQWTAVLQPVSVTGYALGGGQDLAALVAGMKRETPLQDRLDGRYSASVSVPVGEPLPAVRLLHAGSSVEVTGLTQALPVRRVRVVVEKLQIIDAQESHTDPGEFVFETVVAPASARDRAVRRRFPEQGELKLNDDQSLELKAVIFDGLIEDGSSMVVSVGAVEFDFFPDTTRTTSLPSYRRTFSGPPTDWAGRYVPGDEKHDQEDLRDWKIWYRVEVH
jgi:hypothetical protein